MHVIQKLADVFARLPGIGRRQSKRFVFFLLGQDQAFLDTLAESIKTLRHSISECAECHRYFDHDGEKVCSFCANVHRDQSVLMVVEKDVDLDIIERSGAYDGRYFVLGGTIPILDEAPERRVRLNALVALLSERMTQGLAEIIIATGLTPEGENTAFFVRQKIDPLLAGKSVKVSLLGRGLSTGTELEYSDSDTIKSALSSRK